MAADLAGRTALVTGGGRGVGAAGATALAREGAAVAVADIDEHVANEHAEQLRNAGADAIGIQLDVRDETAWSRALGAVEGQLGPVTVLFNNAGVGSTRNERGEILRLHELPLVEWRKVFEVNVRGVYLGMQAVVPGMRRAGGGSIINTASIASFLGSRVCAYGSSKGAVRSLTMSAAVNLAPDGIRVNSVHPGVIRTRMTEERLASPQVQTETNARYPLGRVGEPLEIGEAVAFLASDRASFMTGSAVVIDGGITAW